MSPLFIIAIILIGVYAYKQGLFTSFLGGGTTPPPGGTPPPSGGPLPPGTPFHFSSAGDFRDNGETNLNLAANNPSIVVLLGDYSYNGDPEGWWSGNMDAITGLDVIGAIGNHDDGVGGGFLELFNQNQGDEFIYKISNVAFVCFNTGECSGQCSDPSTVDSLLAQAEADPEVAHIIPFAHKPIFTPTANDISPDGDPGYHAVFAKYSKVRMVLAGHNHFYARMNAASGTNFIYVTVGNGGANPHSDSEEPASDCHYHVSNGCLHCDVNNETISCNMISNEGATHDSFTINPGAPPTDGCMIAQTPTGGDAESANDADQASLATVRRVLMARYGEA